MENGKKHNKDFYFLLIKINLVRIISYFMQTDLTLKVFFLLAFNSSSKF